MIRLISVVRCVFVIVTRLLEYDLLAHIKQNVLIVCDRLKRQMMYPNIDLHNAISFPVMLGCADLRVAFRIEVVGSKTA